MGPPETPQDRTTGRAGAIRLDEPAAASPAATERIDGGPPPGPGGPARRRLLRGGAVLLAGGACWLLAPGRRPATGETAPGRPTGPAPGGPAPKPLWTVRGPALQAPYRGGAPVAPLFVTASQVRVLDPATGAERRRIDLPPARARSAAGRLLVCADRIFDSADGYLTAHHLSDAAADRRTAPAPQLGGPDDAPVLDCYEGGVLFGRTFGDGTRDPLLFALPAESATPLWSRPGTESGGGLVEVRTAPGGRLLARSERDELLALDAATGTPLWLVPADLALGRIETDALHVYTAARGGGLRALRLTDGADSWALAPERGDDWRCLRPLATAGALFVPRDNGLVSRHSPPTAPCCGPAPCRSGWTTGPGRSWSAVPSSSRAPGRAGSAPWTPTPARSAGSSGTRTRGRTRGRGRGSGSWTPTACGCSPGTTASCTPCRSTDPLPARPRIRATRGQRQRW